MTLTAANSALAGISQAQQQITDNTGQPSPNRLISRHMHVPEFVTQII